MPVYKYKCRGCNDEFEITQGIKDNPLLQCDECGGSIFRVMQPVGVSYNSSGFYTTDNRKSAPSFSDYVKAERGT